MTIKELLEILSQYHPDTPIVVQGYEGGYNDISIVEQLSIQMNINYEHYYGAHGKTDTRDTAIHDIPFTNVVYLKGINHLARW